MNDLEMETLLKQLFGIPDNQFSTPLPEAVMAYSTTVFLLKLRKVIGTFTEVPGIRNPHNLHLLYRASVNIPLYIHPLGHLSTSVQLHWDMMLALSTVLIGAPLSTQRKLGRFPFLIGDIKLWV